MASDPAGDDDDDAFPEGAALVRAAKPARRDATAELMRANIRRALVGVDEPPRLGRFVVLDTVGRGAMGVVLAAYDPVLDRRVALKLLRTDDDDGRDALLAEARILAKLAHPHIVGVYEADRIDDQVVIAMPFVAGPDLRAWLRERPRGLDEVVPVFIAIAHALAAAHAQGVVHGDLKPENVLLDDHATLRVADRVRVADFGMARVLAERSGAPEGDTQRIGGTPAYLSPERRAGSPASATADQYAFGVALHEALFGVRPGDGIEPRARRLPSHVRRVLQRALADDPALRATDMTAIADELAAPPRHRARLGTVVAIASIVAVAWFAGARTHDDPCAAAAARAPQLWDDAAAARLHDAFVATGQAGAPALAARVDAGLLARRDAWAVARHEVCAATRVRAEQSDSLHDARMACLDRRADELQALADALQHVASRTEVAAAISAIDELPSLGRCDADRVGDRDRTDTDDPRRAALDRAHAALALGRYDQAAAIATELCDDDGDDPQLHAEAEALLGAAQARTAGAAIAAATLHRARREAAVVGDDRLLAEVTRRQLQQALFTAALPEVEAIAEHARVAALRAQEPLAEIDAVVAEARLEAGDAAGAIALLETVLPALERADRRALAQVTLGSAQLAQGHAADALHSYERALATATAYFGPEHPALDFYAHRRARGLRATGHPEHARRELLRVLASRTATLGADDRAIASVLEDLAQCERALDRRDDARTHLERAIAIRTAHYGPTHVRLAELYAALGDLDRDDGDPARAREHYEHALRLRATTPEHPEVAVLRARIAALPSSASTPTQQR